MRAGRPTTFLLIGLLGLSLYGNGRGQEPVSVSAPGLNSSGVRPSVQGATSNPSTTSPVFANPAKSTPLLPTTTPSSAVSGMPPNLTDDQRRRLTVWQHQLDDLMLYLNDAVDTHLKLKLDLPLSTVLQKQTDALLPMERMRYDIATQQFQSASDQYRQARQLLEDAKNLTTPSYHVEGRAIWLDRGSIIASQTPQGLQLLLRQLHDLGINVVFFETLNAGFPLYKSAILPKNPLLSDTWDPLQVAVDTGHQLGMEVHAWVWCFAVGNLKHNSIIQQPPEYAGPILMDKGMMSEALRGATGNLIPKKGKQAEYWLSPASQKARDFLISLYQEIVSRYAVDGLQLDYIRYPFQGNSAATLMGYEPEGRRRFEEETGLYLNSLDDYTLKSFAAWKTYQVTQFVQQVSDNLRKIRPGLKISGAVYPMRRAERILAIQQDWETWLDNGWFDLLCPMTYTPVASDYQRTLAYFKTTTQKPAIYYPGIALHRVDAEAVVKLQQISRASGHQGNTLFANAHLNSLTANRLQQGPYRRRPAVPPHRNPTLAAQLIITDLIAAAQTFHKAGDPTFDNSLGLLVPLQTQLASLTANPSVATVEQIKPLQAQLLQQVEWLQYPTHPYRVLWFKTQLIQLHSLLGYTLGRLGNPTTGTL